MACTGVGSGGASGAAAKRSANDGWCASRPLAIIGTILVASHAVTLAALKYPLSASKVSDLPSSSGSAASFSTIGASCCLSLAACTTSAATTSRLSAATTAWAL